MGADSPSELAIAEAGLGDRIEVAYHPEIYATKGFQGVTAEIKRRFPGQPHSKAVSRINYKRFSVF